jgi:RND family efflux transporter MFP subunit
MRHALRRLAGGALALGAAWSAADAGLPAPARAQPRGVAGDGLECMVEPMQSVVVSAPVAAVVQEVLVERGDFVERGQVIARLESSVEQATVASARARTEASAELRAAEARHAYEQSRRNRSQELRQSGVLSAQEEEESNSAKLVAEADVLRARENRELARLELRRAQALLERRTIHSPIDGVVVRRLLHPGEYADPLELMELAQLDPLRVEVFAPVAMLGRIQVGTIGRVVLEEPLSSVHEAEVVVVDRVVDAASGTFGVRLEIPNADHVLPAGLRCQVRFGGGANAAERRDIVEPDPS